MQENFIGRFLGQYLIEDAINSGGMATVYRGRHTQTAQIVAVKVLPVYFAHDPRFTKRFQREARAVALLNHPHIVRVYTSGEADGVPYIVMEYVGGGTLKEVMERGVLSLDRAVVLIEQVASALTYAHHKGIVHRDVKPSNVLLVNLDVAKLSDFGIAKFADDSTTVMTALTGTGIGLGTAAYMAPEQATEASHVDPRADVYSLGVMLYQIVAGRLPYNADTPMGLIAQHLYEPVPVVQRDAPAAPTAVGRVLLKAMSKNPDGRFDSAEELARAFKDAVAGRPVNVILPEESDPALEGPTRLVDPAAGERTRLDTPGRVVSPTLPEVAVDDISDLELNLGPDQEKVFRAALAAYDAGDLDLARGLLNDMLREDDQIAEAWLLLSFVEDNFFDQLQCAENAVAVAPDLEDARLRLEQIQGQRLPGTFGRARSQIRAVQRAHDQAMDAYLASSRLEALDSLDNPDQCPYCGMVNDPRRNICVKCSQSLMRSVPPQKIATPALHNALTLNFATLALAIIQLVPPLLWTWYINVPDPSRVRMFIDDVFATQAARLVLGDFREVLNMDLFGLLVALGIVRVLLLILMAVGLRLRWAWVYYLSLLIFAFEGVWGLLAVALGWTGWIIGPLSALAAFSGLMMLGSASENFRVNSQRILVLPEGRLKSGAAYLQLGKEYQRRGMWALAVAQYRAAGAPPPHPPAHDKSLGIGYNKLGRLDRALPILEQAQRLDPADMETMVLLKRLKHDLAAAQPAPEQARQPRAGGDKPTGTKPARPKADLPQGSGTPQAGGTRRTPDKDGRR
jgi:serine/threonine protein kinase